MQEENFVPLKVVEKLSFSFVWTANALAAFVVGPLLQLFQIVNA